MYIFIRPVFLSVCLSSCRPVGLPVCLSVCILFVCPAESYPSSCRPVFSGAHLSMYVCYHASKTGTPSATLGWWDSASNACFLPGGFNLRGQPFIPRCGVPWFGSLSLRLECLCTAKLPLARISLTSACGIGRDGCKHGMVQHNHVPAISISIAHHPHPSESDRIIRHTSALRLPSFSYSAPSLVSIISSHCSASDMDGICSRLRRCARESRFISKALGLSFDHDVDSKGAGAEKGWDR
jgi:hypothetical protein